MESVFPKWQNEFKTDNCVVLALNVQEKNVNVEKILKGNKSTFPVLKETEHIEFDVKNRLEKDHP